MRHSIPSGAAGHSGMAQGQGIGGIRAAQSLAACELDFVEYIADMLQELRGMAQAAEAETLSGLLELAHREAQLRLKQPPIR